MEHDHPLTGLRVVDLSTGIPGGYCSKLLADAGADVIKVEPPHGDPLRSHSDGVLFEFLHTSKRSIVLDLENEDDRDTLLVLYTTADLVIESFEPGVIESLGLGYDALESRNARATMLSISNFGRGGPWTNRPGSEFTLLAQAGSTATRGLPGRPFVNAGGRIGDWMGGVNAGVAALAALRRAQACGRGDHVDLSLLEAVTPTCTNVQSLYGSMTGVYDAQPRLEIPSIEPTKDGYVGFCIFTGQQWIDFCVLIGQPELADDPELANIGGRIAMGERVFSLVHDFTTAHTTQEVVEIATMLRIPVAPIGNGASIPTMDHFIERGVFAENPNRGFLQPRVPYRITGHSTRPFTTAPSLGQQGREIRNELARGRSALAPERLQADLANSPSETAGLRDDAWPLTGVRVVDMTAFWAGPYATYTLACLGADVIHVESVQRPDGMRFGSVQPPSVDEWWEWGPTFHSANAGKRSITLDLTREDGRALLRRLIEQSDVLVENYSARVMEQFGLTWDVVHAWNPRLIMVRMPAFGLDGPWRDRVGFAQTMEQVSGMAWLCGYADTAPMNARGPCDPLAGLHAAYAALVGLHLREQTGLGTHIEATMVETALNAAAEQVIEWSAHGRLLSRDGNHHHGVAPQGVYTVADEPEGTMDAVALCVETDAQWRALVELIDDVRLRDERFGNLDERLAARDLLDDVLAAWCAARGCDEAVQSLLSAGVPAAPVVGARCGDRNPQNDARGFYEAVEHPVAGTHRIGAFPVVFARQPKARFSRPAPRLGEHNREVLGGLLGVDDDELARLTAAKIIGTRPGG
jgi:crotonobetainyl-CoA:carnitine CoA-transferase CaiB-like acyl-CoA transferase